MLLQLVAWCVPALKVLLRVLHVEISTCIPGPCSRLVFLGDLIVIFGRASPFLSYPGKSPWAVEGTDHQKSEAEWEGQKKFHYEKSMWKDAYSQKWQKYWIEVKEIHPTNQKEVTWEEETTPARFPLPVHFPFISVVTHAGLVWTVTNLCETPLSSTHVQAPHPHKSDKHKNQHCNNQVQLQLTMAVWLRDKSLRNLFIFWNTLLSQFCAMPLLTSSHLNLQL